MTKRTSVTYLRVALWGIITVFAITIALPQQASALGSIAEDDKIKVSDEEVDDSTSGDRNRRAPDTEKALHGKEAGSTSGTPGQVLRDFTFSRRAAAHGGYDCSRDANGYQSCTASRTACTAAPDYTITNGDIVARARPNHNAGPDQVTMESVTRNISSGRETSNGYSCVTPGSAVPANAASPGGEPVVITVTRRDFAELPVQPLAANAGPEEGWLPVNMVNVLHTNPEAQTLDTELLGVPVQVRAVPIEYHWDLGDGNTITTTKPGKPFPSEQVTATYSHEGWYDITLTTTFAGQFSVDGGEWRDIDGTIEIASDPVEIFSKSLESRLVNSDVPVDEDTDPWIPARSPETEGPRDPEATHREI